METQYRNEDRKDSNLFIGRILKGNNRLDQDGLKTMYFRFLRLL